MKRKIRLYNHDFEVVVSPQDPITGKYRATVNYAGYPHSFGIDYGYSEEEAIDTTIRKILKASPLDVVKILAD